MTRTVRVANMSDEVYYAPQFVAQQAGFFADEGLDVEAVLVATCDVPDVLDRGDVELALCGMWQPWLYQERFGREYTVFAQLNQQVPLMVYGRVPADEFDWAALSDGGTTMLTSLVACSPWAALQGVLLAKGVDLGTMRMVDGFPPHEAHALFGAGYADAVEVFSSLDAVPFVADEQLHEIVNWEGDLGRIPWSVYFGSKARMGELHDVSVAFTRALGRAQSWMREHDADAVTAMVEPCFAGVPAERLRPVIAHFLATEQWPADPAVQLDASARWQAILGRVGILAPGQPVEALVDSDIAAAAMVGA